MSRSKIRNGRRGYGNLLTVNEHEESVFSSYMSSRRRSKVRIQILFENPILKDFILRIGPIVKKK